jgi:hypothetical protein
MGIEPGLAPFGGRERRIQPEIRPVIAGCRSNQQQRRG